MNRKLTSEQIESTCRELLGGRRHVTVRDAMAELQRRHGAAGRTERVSRILSRLETHQPFEPTHVEAPAPDATALLERLDAAEARAARSEEMERRHQDYWAERYAEKADELERKYSAILQARPPITTDQYLRLQRRVAELSRRLSKYEDVEP